MSDPSLPALPVSNVSFHSSRLPADWSLWSRCYCLFQRFGFKRRRAFWGCAHICSLPLPPLFLSFMFPFSSLPRRLRVFVFSFFLLSSQDRWEQTAWQFSSPFFIHFLVFFLWLLSLYSSLCISPFSPNWDERNPWSTILKEGSQLWCIFTHKHAASWIWPTVYVHRYPSTQTNTVIKTYTLYHNTGANQIKLLLMRET